MGQIFWEISEKFPNSTNLQENGQGYYYDTDQHYKIKKQSSKFFELEKFPNSTTLQEIGQGYDYDTDQPYKIKKNSLANILRLRNFSTLQLYAEKKHGLNFLGNF